jgi:hypothetical protein
MPLRSLLLALALLAAACRPAAPPEPAPEPAAPSAAPEAPVPPAPRAADPEVVAEVRAKSLSVPEVRRYAQAAEAVQRLAEDPASPVVDDALEDRIARAESIEEVQAILDADPRVRQALREAGITSRDYVLTGTALLGAYSYVLAREEGHADAARPEYVTDTHVRFVEQNRAEVDAIVVRLQSVYGVDFDDLFEDSL